MPDVERRTCATGWGIDETRAMLTGYAAVFDRPYKLDDGPHGPITERVDRKAFDKTLAGNPDVALLVNHGGLPLATTPSGTLRLSTDDTGLRFEADLDSDDPDTKVVISKVKRGLMPDTSFGFKAVRDEWHPSADGSVERVLREVTIDKKDVSIATFGANPATRGLTEVRKAGEQVYEAWLEQVSEVRRGLEDIVSTWEDGG